MHSDIENLLEADHREIDELLRKLLAAFDADDLEGVAFHLDLFWARLAMHIRAEHLHLFPAILSSLSGDAGITDSIAELRHDHDLFMRELAEAMKQLRKLSAGDGEATSLAGVRERVDRVRQRLADHNRKEEAEIYVFNPDAADALAAAIGRELDNLPPRFASKEGYPGINRRSDRG